MRLLYVEDNEDTIEMTKMWFDHYRYTHIELVFARTAGQALALLSSCDFDGVILDVALPDVEGPIMIEYARERGLHIPPVVLLSAYSGHILDEACAQAGAIAGFVKPTSPNIFLKPLGVSV